MHSVRMRLQAFAFFTRWFGLIEPESALIEVLAGQDTAEHDADLTLGLLYDDGI